MDAHRREAVAAKRRKLVQLRNDDEIDDDVFHALEQELDWEELAAAKPDDQELVEG
jgi:CPA1 family monovalent cation:H+ antiporter